MHILVNPVFLGRLDRVHVQRIGKDNKARSFSIRKPICVKDIRKTVHFNVFVCMYVITVCYLYSVFDLRVLIV